RSFTTASSLCAGTKTDTVGDRISIELGSRAFGEKRSETNPKTSQRIAREKIIALRKIVTGVRFSKTGRPAFAAKVASPKSRAKAPIMRARIARAKLREESIDPRVGPDGIVEMVLAKEGFAPKKFERQSWILSNEGMGLSSSPDDVDADEFAKTKPLAMADCRPQPDDQGDCISEVL